MALDLTALATEMARAIELTMDPSATQQQRLQAYTAYEEFKETSPLCAQCGFYLAQNESMSHFVRHFGLQLIEHCVKYRWNKLVQEEKLYIKENAMKLLYTGVAQEQTHIKDALSRVVVEMIKREWPQQWPNLLTELSDACKLGENQTELVLLVFLRLVEDVVLLKTLESNQRRKDIYQALMSNMANIFIFFLKITEDHCSSYQMKIDSGHVAEATPHLRVVHVALKTLTGFVEWVTMTHIMVADGRLLQILCLLLTRKEFRIPAAECLVQIVNRRGRIADRKPLMILFSEDALQCMFRGFESSDDDRESHYAFLKLLAQVLVGLGSQLSWLWDKDSGTVGRPVYFKLFLSLILRFTEHPSLTLTHAVNDVWVTFMRSDPISKDSCFLEYLPNWLQATARKIIKVDYPSLGNNAELAFLCKDFATEEEFSIYFGRFRHDLLKAVRQVTLVSPHMTFAYVEKWLLVCLCQALPEQTDRFPEWEAMSQVLDSTLASIRSVAGQPIVEQGLRLLVACLNYNTPHPVVLSILLSCISSLFVFISLNPNDENTSHLLPQVLDKIFAALVYVMPGHDSKVPSLEERNLHSHAANLMVKLSRKYPETLLPIFDQIHGTILGLSSDPTHLAWRDKVSLQEALLLLCNQFCDYERQTRFIEDMVNFWKKRWLELGSKAFKSPQEFVTFLGLDQPAVEVSKEDLYSQNRSNLHCCCTLLMIAVKHSTWPDDVSRAMRGGFCSGDPPEFRNPAAPHVIPLLPTLLGLVKVFNAVWTPAALSLLSEGYRLSFTIMVQDRSMMISGNPPPGETLDSSRERTKTPVERMRFLLTAIYDNCNVILGSACTNLGKDFYGLVGLAPSLIDSVFSNLELVPDFRLRPLVGKFLKLFVSSCPPAYYESVLLPVLGHFCPYMFQRLNNKWQYITHQQEVDDESSEQQEVTEDMMTRLLTRDYIDVLKVLVLVGAVQPVGNNCSMEQDETPRYNSILHTKVSDVGALVLHHEATCQAIVLCIFRALSWNDTIASMMATWLAAPVVRKLATDGSLTPPVASYIMTSILQGLQTHGQHETNSCSLYTLGIVAYEILRPEFPNIVEVMMQIPGCVEADVKKLDDKVLANKVAVPPGSKIEKSKRDAFIRVASKLVGCSVGQLFRKEVSIADLPRLQLMTERPKQIPLDEQIKDDETLCPMFSPSRS
ncbi:exportin-5 [Anabrus simplex]|uniref:exportin-5 n=1 Tax=Anabrus simplex TaxID=316456 RepID=UPI0034DD8803